MGCKAITVILVLMLNLRAVSAAELTFDLVSVPSDVASYTLDVDDVSLTIDNAAGPVTTFVRALGGLAFSEFNTPVAADLRFSHDVQLLRYVVANDETDGSGAFFDLVQGDTASLGNDVSSLGGFAFTNTLSVFVQNTAIRLISGDAAINGGQEFEAWAISSLTVRTVSSAVPVPVPLWLMGSAWVGLIMRRGHR